MKKIPVNIISGFLGSGKTTAILQLLDHKSCYENWAIVINEFGKISIDGQTLQEKSANGNVFDIPGGCICCSAREYLNENLENIFQTGKYHRIIIEPSGLGGLDMVSGIVELNPGLKLMPILCMVDITITENKRLQMNLIHNNQISRADKIIFSKIDLLSNVEKKEELIGKFKLRFPQKKHFLNVENFTPAVLDFDEIETQNIQLFVNQNPHLLTNNYEERLIFFDKNQVFDSEKLIDFFVEHQSIVRAKGHIQTENGWKLVNFTLSGYTFDACFPKNQGELVIITENSAMIQLPDFQEKLKTLSV